MAAAEVVPEDGAGSARIGVFGGAFDPPHTGHLIAALDAVEALRLDRLLFVPTGVPPHKPDRALTPGPLRIAMIEAAVEGCDRLAVETWELDRLERGERGPSYTVETLREMRRRHPDARLFLLLGADQFRAFGSWREPGEVARLARLAVMARDGESPREAAPGMEVPWTAVPVTRVDVSSTEVRERIRRGLTVRYRVPEAARAIIERERLYADPVAPSAAAARAE